MKKIIGAVAALCIGASTASAANIAETAASAGQFNTLLTAAEAAGLVPALTGHTKLTVFAPTDAAFAKLPKPFVDKLLANPEKLAEVLKYHVVAGEVMVADIPAGVSNVPTLKESGDTVVTTTRFGNSVTVDFARVTSADIKADNGVIHVIDTVLVPIN